MTKRQRKHLDPLNLASGAGTGTAACGPARRRSAPAPKQTPAALTEAQAPNGQEPISTGLFFSDRDGDRAAALAGLRKSILGFSPGAGLPETGWTSVDHGNQRFFFAHFSGDYIPETISKRGQFYEAPFLHLLARLHEPGKLIIDGGANIGNHSIFFAGVMGAQVMAFEPQPYNFGFLHANVHLNRLEQRVQIRKTAIGEEAGQIELAQLQSGNYGSFTADAALIDKAGIASPRAERFQARISTLDEELAGLRHAVSMIKLDLEGMELAALRGARKTLAESTPVVAVECFTKSIYQGVRDFLAPFGYFVIDSTNATPTFLFLSRQNPRHQEMLATYLELSSLGRFASNNAFNETGE